MIKKKDQETEASIATGIDDDEELSQRATEEEIKKGEYTRVTSLRYDEDPRA
ncbi:hypothetical protein [Evansella tamaricis]|uniref:Uncharacterized protein n=1 Tax=Evansella tamaricis TaxID=2069301 RepID=A0ABS6JNU0_9BACI|nr:hypothetical protein [Evansella tamaricis]MBU9714065.1 hypothetical protein [Evansella tamaricis]